jgi:hypothetical protein
MAKAERIEIDSLPMVIAMAMTKLFHIIPPIGGVPARERPSVITVR